MTSSPTLDKCHAHPVHTVTGPFPYQRSVATKGQSPTMTSQNVHVQRPQNHRATRGWHHGNVTVKPTVISKWTTWSTLAPIATKTSSQKGSYLEHTAQNHLGQRWKCHSCDQYFVRRLDRTLHIVSVHPYEPRSATEKTDFVGGLRPPRKTCNTDETVQEIRRK